MPLVNSSIPTDLRTLMQLGHSDPATAPEGDVGSTSHPQNGQAAQWVINVIPADGNNGQYFGQLVVNQTSVEGDNTSHYLTAGIYETNLAIDWPEYLQDPHVRRCLRPFNGYDNDRVYLYLTDAIATLNSYAEAEHCGDLFYAYHNCLVRLDDALNAVAARGRIGPVSNANEVQPLVESQIRNLLPVALRALPLTQNAFLAEYQRLCAQTVLRDQHGYHEFGMQLLNARPAGNITYLTGAARDGNHVRPRYVQLTPGGTAIGVHPSSTLII